MTDIEEYEEEDYESDLKKELFAKTELKSCPFCGSKSVQCTQDIYGHWGVECLARGCHAYLTNAKWANENKETAIDLWNRRVNE